MIFFPKQYVWCVFCEVQIEFLDIIEIDVRLDRFNVLDLNRQCLGV